MADVFQQVIYNKEISIDSHRIESLQQNSLIDAGFTLVASTFLCSLLLG